MTTAELTARLLHVFEGCKLKAYWDKTGKVFTIGFGSTQGVTEGMEITYAEAVAMLERDIAPLLELVKGRPVLEAAALVSFGYNCGIGALRKVLDGKAQLQSYIKSGGVVLPGLVARRGLESALVETANDEKRS